MKEQYHTERYWLSVPVRRMSVRSTHLFALYYWIHSLRFEATSLELKAVRSRWESPGGKKEMEIVEFKSLPGSDRKRFLSLVLMGDRLAIFAGYSSDKLFSRFKLEFHCNGRPVMVRISQESFGKGVVVLSLSELELLHRSGQVDRMIIDPFDLDWDLMMRRQQRCGRRRKTPGTQSYNRVEYRKPPNKWRTNIF